MKQNHPTKSPGAVDRDAADRAREAALAALEHGDRAGARGRLEAALADYRALGLRPEAMQTRMAIGLTWLRAGGDEAEAAAFDALREATREAIGLGDATFTKKGIGYLAEVSGTAERLLELEALVAAAEPFLDDEGRVAVAAGLAAARTLAGDVRRGVQAVADPAMAEVLKKAADPGAAGYARLLAAGQAEARGDLETAEREAHAAKASALETTDPVLYVIASGAIARFRDARGDRVGALTALFTCKASVEDLLGREAGGRVVPMIDALEARWGAAAFQEALAGYRRQFD